jgi:cytochrome c551
MPLRTLLLALAVGLATGCAGGDDTDTDTDTADDTDTDTDTAGGPDLANGGAVYAQRCSACHAADGTGGSGPNLNYRVPGLDDTEVRAVIRNGKNTMPAFNAASIADADLDDLVAFLRDRHG